MKKYYTTLEEDPEYMRKMDQETAEFKKKRGDGTASLVRYKANVGRMEGLIERLNVAGYSNTMDIVADAAAFHDLKETAGILKSNIKVLQEGFELGDETLQQLEDK